MALAWFLQTIEDIGGSLEDTEDTPKMVENSHGSTPFPKQNDPKIPQLSTPVSQHRATRPGNSFHGGNNDRPALRAQQATVVSRWASFSVSESQIDPRG